MRLVLDHPRLADQAITDLARWKDWEVMDRLVGLFNSSDPDVNTWVRIPVINYLRACPLPKAKQYIEALRKIDPKAVRQSETLYAVGPDPTPSVTIQSSPSAVNEIVAATSTSADRGPASEEAAGTRAEFLPIVAPEQPTGSSDRMPPLYEWLVALAVLIGIIAVAAAARGRWKKSPAQPAPEQF